MPTRPARMRPRQTGWHPACSCRGPMLPVLVASLLVALSPPAAPVEPARVNTTLLTDPTVLIRWLEKKDQEVQAAHTRVGQARTQVNQALLWLPNPQVNAAVGGWPLGPTNPPGLAITQTPNFSVGMSQTLEVAKRGPRIRAAEYGLDSEKEAYVAALHERMADVRSALAQVVYHRERTHLLEVSLADAETMLQLERARQHSGLLSTLDLDRMELDQTAQHAELSGARAELAQAMGVCAAILLAPCDLDNATMDTLAALAPPAAPSDWLHQHPQVRALRLAGGASDQAATLERRKILPDPTLSLGYTHDRFVVSGNNPNTVMMGVSIPLPVFDRGQNTGARESLRARELALQASALMARMAAAKAGLAQRQKETRRALRELEDAGLPKAVQIEQRTAQAFHMGEATVTEVLMARRTSLSMRQRRQDLQLSLFMVANDLRRLIAADAHLIRENTRALHG